MTSTADRTSCAACADGQEAAANGTCAVCKPGYYANADTGRKCTLCPSGFFSTAPGAKACDPCRACPDGFYRAGCSSAGGGGTCRACTACGAGKVSVGCMNRAGHSDMPGTCRNRTYVVRNPLCDEKASGLGLGGYTFLALFGVPQDDASFQCRRRCDNQQNKLSADVYTDNATYYDLLAQFQQNRTLPRVFDGGHCGGPYACDVANCNIPGSSDDSQTDYQTRLACPVYVEPAAAQQFWTAVDSGGSVDAVDAKRAAKCQPCASCGEGNLRGVEDWGRGCARDCTTLTCAAGLIYDWTEPDATAKCKPCADLDDVRLCLSSDQRVFDGYDVSGRLPKVFMKNCNAKLPLPRRAYEHSYGDCVKCADFADACATGDAYYHSCADGSAGQEPTCKPCSRAYGRAPGLGRFWDGSAFRHLYCQQQPCAASAGVAYTGINTAATPHRLCSAACAPLACDGGAAQVALPCVLPHQRRCRDSVNMDAAVADARFAPRAYTPAHSNVLEPISEATHLFASFENALVDAAAPQLSRRAQCVWNADFIPDNAVNPGGVSSRFARECRASARDARTRYPLAPLQNTVAGDESFSRRVLLNTSAQAVAYSAGEVERPGAVFAGDVYLQLDMTNAHNATLAVFVPPDRGLSSATWVPRWRASVVARQVAGGPTRLLLDAGQEQTCFECFSLLILSGTSPPLATTSLQVATAAFAGDKYAFQHAPGLRVCERATQARAYAPLLAAACDASLAPLFASSLTDACVGSFGVQAHASQVFPQEVRRASGIVLTGDCLLYLFSASGAHCLWRGNGTVLALAWSTPPAVAQGTLLDFAVHDRVVVRTLNSGMFAPGDPTNYVSLLSSAGSASESVLAVPGLLMFARGEPRYFLRRASAATLLIAKFETRNATFRLNESANYSTNVVGVLFSSFVPVSAANTVLEHNEDVLVFATARYSGEQVFVHVAALDRRLAPLATYSMPVAVFAVARDAAPARVDARFEAISSAGEAVLSVAWPAPGVLLLSVAVEGAADSLIAPLLLNVSDLTVLAGTQHPDLASAFAAPFVRAGGAVVSRGRLLSCSECLPTSTALNSSGFFAYGASPVSYRRLLQCDAPDGFFEEGIARAMPVDCCAKVRATASDPFLQVVVDLTLRCATTAPLEVLLEVATGSSVQFGGGQEYTRLRVTRLLVTAECDSDGSLAGVVAYDSGDCAAGCARVLWPGGGLRLTGGVRIESVRHRPRLSPASATWDRRRLLRLGLSSAAYVWTPMAGAWQEHSVIARKVAELQRLDVSLQRDVSVERLAALNGGDAEQSVALDALALLPVLSEHFVPGVAADNASTLAAIVYVPSAENLRDLALEPVAFGDDLGNWARVHASVHVAAVPADQRQCSFLARVVAVDATYAEIAAPAHTGCLLDLARSPQCHVELPVRLALPANRVVGVQLRATTPGCRALSEAADVSVELAPFMRISRCPQGAFLHADTLTCAPCDDGEPFCPAGRYVEGCLALLHPSVVPRCLNCTVPANAFFPNTSAGCDAWQCRAQSYRAGAVCVPCTALGNATLTELANATACRATGGRRFEACSAFENEKCVDCAPKPRYSEWAVERGAECTWRCKDGYFATAGSCELCATFADAAAALGVSGSRVAGLFYRFAACSATAQARAEACSPLDFGYDVQGAYVGDARAFGEDCQLQCANDSNKHSVRVTASRAGAVWSARVCQTCANSTWPVLARSGARLPRSAFEMSTACAATCLAGEGYFPAPARLSGANASCLFCPPDACPSGSFWAASDDCAACQPCARTLAGSEFTRAGPFDDAYACGERCPAGAFRADNATCTPHSTLACTAGSEYEIAGTPDADGACGTCADCSFARETAPCTLASNRQCASCGALDPWSSAWSRAGCELLCRTDQGYTKLFGATEVCRKCVSCPPGRALPVRPANCSCAPCAEPLPARALYTSGCEWACPLYHVAQRNAAGALVCTYTPRPTSNAPTVLGAVPASCVPGESLAQSGSACEACTTPAGLRLQDLNATWTWDRACAWQCAWGLEKQLTLGAYRCEGLHFVRRTGNASAPPTRTGVVAASVVLAVFSLCLRILD